MQSGFLTKRGQEGIHAPMSKRLFWLMTGICFMWVSTHEAVAHVDCACNHGEAVGAYPDDHTARSTSPDDSHHPEDDDHDGDSHGHFRGAVDVPVKTTLMARPAFLTTVEADTTAIPSQWSLSCSWRQASHFLVTGPPHYLRAQSLLL